MALPSSPPLLPEADAAPSPPPLSDEAADLPIRPSELSIPGRSRKRQLSDYGSLSSDPLFSEGTSEAEEEYGGERRDRKRLVRGPWWNLSKSPRRSLRQRMAKRERMRNLDSGVWLGSDLSDESVDSTLSSQERMATLEVEDRSNLLVPHALQDKQQHLSAAENLASKAITRCLETGQESIDLTDLNLSELSDGTLKPLHQFIRHTHTDLTQPPSEDEFTPLTPSIQLFLSGNKLISLPSELFRLTNITVLSLRNNSLSEIPPSIGQLPNLRELNIAQNNIKWLPWEMLDLLHCRGNHRQITIRPNPLISPVDGSDGYPPLPRPKVSPSEYNEHLSRWGETSGAFFSKMKQWYSKEGEPWTMRHELELRLKLGRLKRTMYLQEASRAGTELKLCREQLVYLASSTVRFFDANGAPWRAGTPTTLLSDEQRFHAVVDPLAGSPNISDTTSCPSMFEMALRKIQASFNLSDFPDDLPSAITAGLQQAAEGAEYGNQKCSVCGNSFIVPRAEWIESWFNGFPSQECLTQETVLPFLRKVCSWRCVQPNEIGAFRF